MNGRPLVPLLIALGTLGTSIGFALIPPAHNEAPIYRAVGLVAIVWHLFFVAGGVLILVGWYRRRVDVEAAGYVISATGAMVYVIAAFSIRGWAAWTAGCLITTLAGGQIGRALSAIRGEHP